MTKIDWFPFILFMVVVVLLTAICYFVWNLPRPAEAQGTETSTGLKIERSVDQELGVACYSVHDRGGASNQVALSCVHVTERIQPRPAEAIPDDVVDP